MQDAHMSVYIGLDTNFDPKKKRRIRRHQENSMGKLAIPLVPDIHRVKYPTRGKTHIRLMPINTSCLTIGTI